MVPRTAVNASQAIATALNIFDGHDTAYDQQKRMQHNPGNWPKFYDCSSFVGTCWGFSSPPSTKYMLDKYTDSGFVPYSLSNFVGGGGTMNFQPGDIIVWRIRDDSQTTHDLYHAWGHTMMYIGSQPGRNFTAIHCTTANSAWTPSGYRGGVQPKYGSLFPSNQYLSLARSFVLRGSGGVYITQIKQYKNGEWITIFQR